jgi:hypothetical protein
MGLAELLMLPTMLNFWLVLQGSVQLVRRHLCKGYGVSARLALEIGEGVTDLKMLPHGYASLLTFLSPAFWWPFSKVCLCCPC